MTRPGDKYDLFKGTQEHFAIAYRVTTMEARYEDMVLRQGHHVEQWRLLLEKAEAEALLCSLCLGQLRAWLRLRLSHLVQELHDGDHRDLGWHCDLFLA